MESWIAVAIGVPCIAATLAWIASMGRDADYDECVAVTYLDELTPYPAAPDASTVRQIRSTRVAS